MIRTAHYSHEATERLVRCFLATTGGTINGYSEAAARNKAQFHRLGKILLRGMALELGYASGTFAVRNNFAGIAVSGEITLHADDLYVQFSKSCFGNGSLDILYRTCQGRTDYTGGRNHFLPFSALEDYGQTLALLGALKREAR
jgi:hypothetical protein